MGCGTSKKHLPCEKEVNVEEGELATGSEFTLTLWRRPSKEKVGLSVTNEVDGTLRVEGIKDDGLVADFMKANANEIDHHIEVGHTIVAVNDVSGDCEAMKREFDEKIVVLTVKTVHVPTSPEASLELDKFVPLALPPDQALRKEEASESAGKERIAMADAEKDMVDAHGVPPGFVGAPASSEVLRILTTPKLHVTSPKPLDLNRDDTSVSIDCDGNSANDASRARCCPTQVFEVEVNSYVHAAGPILGFECCSDSRLVKGM
eukprot:TRINITY_DN36799_c0_g1_i1.p1 TRINITY_DN36799_c0_g1~~TRINITY_DN36799_c0_g1_i1.p1  ORF type:complete len:287 (+),score=49.58 TRINITY_DN36799_c0_g1_i1:77-862(+)